MNDQAIENEIQAKGLVAPRVTLADLLANIVDVEIIKHVSKTGQVRRWAILTTQNGFAVVGRPSVAASPENDNAPIGEKVAVDNSRAELWPLMGYALKERLAATTAVSDLDTVTFDEFLQYGRDARDDHGGAMPYSFTFRGHHVTHENDRCYIIANGSIDGLRFTPDDVLVVNPDGSLVTMRAETPKL